MDPDRALRVQRSASFAHRRLRSNIPLARQRMRTKSAKGGPDFVGDFEAIDWMNEDSRFLGREVNEFSTKRQKLLAMYIVLTVTGICTAFVGVILDSSVAYLTSLRSGICVNAFYLSREVCCLPSRDENCANFYTWGEFMSDKFAFHPDVGNFLINLCFACVYGFTSAWMVKRLAPHAAGSGIPEIKAVLNGCVMRGFFSAWTFVVKIVGLVLSVSAGLNLGKEGPVVHLASCIAFLTAERYKIFRYNQVAVRLAF